MTVKTKGVVSDLSSVVGTWLVVAVDWGCKGSAVRAGPFTFNADGSWTYSFGGGRWIQVGGMVAWNFTNAAGLIYSANINPNAMSGIMGYATSGPILKGCFYALRSPSPAASAETPSALASLPGTAQESAGDVVVGPPGDADRTGDAAVGEP
jgi:hypothetical protein